MGVWLATDLDFGRDIAIKVLRGKGADLAPRSLHARGSRQFLYNAGAATHMKAKATKNKYISTIALYKRYVTADPDASDRAKLETTIAILDETAAAL